MKMKAKNQYAVYVCVFVCVLISTWTHSYRIHIYRVIKNSLCTWRLRYEKHAKIQYFKELGWNWMERTCIENGRRSTRKESRRRNPWREEKPRSTDEKMERRTGINKPSAYMKRRRRLNVNPAKCKTGHYQNNSTRLQIKALTCDNKQPNFFFCETVHSFQPIQRQCLKLEHYRPFTYLFN